MKHLVPVTIIGGYLGAGKTTVVNRLLSAGHGRRLAVLVNDFGAVNIDEELISARDGNTIGLRNGCVCCSIADALGDALDRVLALDPPPEQIIVEASGVADPAKVAYYGQGWPGCRLDAVIVLAGADTIRRQARDEFVGELVTRQLRHADLVVVSRTDLVDQSTAAAVLEWIASVTDADVPVVAAVHGRVDPAVILDAGPSELVPSDRLTTGDLEVERPGFQSRVIELAEPVPRSALERVLEQWPAELVRVKGLVALRGEDGRWLVQRVGRRWSIVWWSSTPPGEARSQLVLISPGDGANLRACEQQLADAIDAATPSANPDAKD